jgi:hypothetical protein
MYPGNTTLPRPPPHCYQAVISLVEIFQLLYTHVSRIWYVHTSSVVARLGVMHLVSGVAQILWLHFTHPAAYCSSKSRFAPPTFYTLSFHMSCLPLRHIFFQPERCGNFTTLAFCCTSRHMGGKHVYTVLSGAEITGQQ